MIIPSITVTRAAPKSLDVHAENQAPSTTNSGMDTLHPKTCERRVSRRALKQLFPTNGMDSPKTTRPAISVHKVKQTLTGQIFQGTLSAPISLGLPKNGILRPTPESGPQSLTLKRKRLDESATTEAQPIKRARHSRKTITTAQAILAIPDGFNLEEKTFTFRDNIYQITEFSKSSTYYSFTISAKQPLLNEYTWHVYTINPQATSKQKLSAVVTSIIRISEYKVLPNLVDGAIWMNPKHLLTKEPTLLPEEKETDVLAENNESIAVVIDKEEVELLAGLATE